MIFTGGVSEKADRKKAEYSGEHCEQYETKIMEKEGKKAPNKDKGHAFSRNWQLIIDFRIFWTRGSHGK